MQPNLLQSVDPGQQASENLSVDERQKETFLDETETDNEFSFSDEELDDSYFDEEKEEQKFKTFRWKWK